MTRSTPNPTRPTLAPGDRASLGGITFMLAALSALGPFCIDTYLPSMPEMGRRFGIPLTTVQQTLTVYMASFAIMTLWHGAISDTIGRRKTILWALALFTLASLGCAIAPGIRALLVFRALQGMTAGTGMVVGRAIVRDLSDGPEAQRMMAAVSMVFAIAPAAAPVIGGWLERFLGWRSVFVFMASFAAGVAVWCWVALPESLPPEARRPFRPSYLARAYWQTISNLPFFAACAGLTFGFSGFFVYVLSAPTFLMKHLHVSETGFFWLFGPMTAGMLTGAWLSRRLAGAVTPARTIMVGLAIMGLAVASNLILHLVVAPGLPHSIVPILVYSFGFSLATPSLTLLALDLFPTQRGLAASCQSFLQSAGNSVNAALIAPFFWATVLRLAVAQALLFGLAALAVVLHLRAQPRT